MKKSNAINIIQNSKILKQEDFSKLDKLKEELFETFKYSQVFRTRTEMEVSVLNDVKHPTSDSKYWQSVREQGVMYDQLVLLSYDYRKNLIKIKKLERKLKKEEDDLERQLIEIDIEKKRYQSIRMEKIAKDRIREIVEWHKIKKKLLPELDCDTKNVDNHQLFSYTRRWIKQWQILSPRATQGEKQNLYGQLLSGLKRCKEKGILDKVLEGLNKEYAIKLKNLVNK